LRQLASISNHEDGVLPVQIQGYPAAQVRPGKEQSTRPGVESLALLTLSIARAERSEVSEGVDFSVEYPPWDGSVDDLGLPPPPGESGGGVWLPAFVDNVFWEPSQTRLVGLVESWKRDTKELFCIHIKQWLSTLVEDIPELGASIAAADLSVQSWKS
jgi:hypothetical protein